MTEATVRSALKSWFTSKKTWTLLIGLASYIAAKKGFQLDEASCWVIAGGFSTLLGGQALADVGKSAATITAATPPGPSVLSAAVAS